MDVREAIYGRRAVREFTTEPVEEAALRRLVDAAIQAPSAVNQQPWLYDRQKQGAAGARFKRSESPYAQNFTGGAGLASFPAHPERSEL